MIIKFIILASILLAAIELVFCLYMQFIVRVHDPSIGRNLERQTHRRKHPVWFLVFMAYHIPIAAILTAGSKDESVSHWMLSLVTFAAYLGIAALAIFGLSSFGYL